MIHKQGTILEFPNENFGKVRGKVKSFEPLIDMYEVVVTHILVDNKFVKFSKTSSPLAQMEVLVFADKSAVKLVGK